MLDVVLADGLLDGVLRRSLVLKQKLARLKDEHPSIIEDIRGAGLMMGIKCRTPNADFQAAALEHKLLTIAAGDNVIRLLPPLVVSDEEITEAVNKLDATCRALEARKAAP